MQLLLRSLWPFFVKYRWQFLWGFVFLIISNWFQLYPAQIVRDAFDLVAELLRAQQIAGAGIVGEGLRQLIWSTVILFSLLVVIAALLRGVFLFLVRQTLIVVSRLIEFDQKQQIFEHYQGFTLRQLRQHRTGDLMARIAEDVSNIRQFTGPVVMYSVNAFITFAMILVVMLYVNPELTLYVMAPLPIISLLIYIVHSHIIKRSEEKQKQLSALSSYAQEAYSGIRLLRAYARETSSRERFRIESEKYQQKAMRLIRIDAIFFPLVMILIGLSTVITVWIGGEKVIEGTITLGNIAEFVIYTNLLIWPVTALGWVTSLMQKAAASQKRVNDILAEMPDIDFPQDGPKITEGHLVFENVGLTYPDTGIIALSKVSFDLPPGRMLGIIGRTGAGKSTLANLCLRLMEPTAGKIYIDGRALQEYTSVELRSAFGYVQQEVFLFSDSLRANIAFGKPGATEEEIIDAAEFAGVWNDIQYLPEGLDTVVGERGVTLSGGQKQRIGIARAYLRKPHILILDDSLSAVDAETEAQILHNLRTRLLTAEHRPTLIVISHRLSAVEYADEVMVLANGRITERGTHLNLLELKGNYAELWHKQLLEAELQA
jgi:ATP-binding cassette, subfamily B, multidrug efflux pump